MKKLALTIILGVTGVALNAQEYTIQTISAKKEASITPAFEKKVHKSALQSVKKKEGICNVVTVGRYDSVKKARADLAKAKAIAKDAFVRPIERNVPKSCESASAAKTDQESPAKESVAAVAHTTTAPATIEKPKEAVAAAPVAAPHPVAPVVQETPKTVSTATVRPTVVVYDRNLARKSDIHDAIEYYKTSPYHTFKPVAMQSR
ncbi:MAG: hypothetical protein PHV10_09030 [Sulfuricurvum sp.]|nr:hypothetical protein [Sulfuricurvum sp.]